MNIKNVLQNLDKLFSENKIDMVENFLSSSLEQAIKENDTSSVITILNELIGFYRDIGKYDMAILYSKKVIILMKNIGLEDTIHYATTLLNVANAYRASGLFEQSLEYYQQTESIYAKLLDKKDFLYASFYNNLSLLYQEMKDYDLSCICLKKALYIAKGYPDAKIEVATTYTNLASSLVKLNKQNEAKSALDKALEIFESFENKDYHYSATLSTMGDLYVLNGDFEKAILYYEKSLTELYTHTGVTPSYMRVMSNMQSCYRKLGKENKIKGLNLSKSFYEKYGKPMIEKLFPNYVDKIAVGLVGEGSECFGFDDEYSTDHDFGIGFYLWVSQETYNEIGEKLQKAYDELPKIYKGFVNNPTKQAKKRKGVRVIEDFYNDIIGTIPKTDKQWFEISEPFLATATNGEVFVDKEGIFTNIRNSIAYYPKEIYMVKLSQELVNASQTGQYNYARMMGRGDYSTARIILNRFIQYTMDILYMLNKKYIPYYKWQYKGLKNLTILKPVVNKLEYLINLECQKEKWIGLENLNSFGRININDNAVKTIEEIAELIVEELNNQGLTNINDKYLELQGESIMNKYTTSENKKNLIKSLIALEWEQFDKVENIGGRADCQNDFETFSIMRKSQYLTWSEDMIESYINDFNNAISVGRNLISEKYARMMESTSPQEYEKIKAKLPIIEDKTKAIISQIIEIQVVMMENLAEKYPKLASNARSIHSSEDSMFNTSYETYLKGELSTYSPDTLVLYARFIADIANSGKNLAELTMLNTVKLYGYSSLDDAEQKI